MKKKSKLKKIIGKIFNLYKEDAEIIFVFFGIKMKFKSPTINRLQELCVIPNLKELQEKNTFFPHPIGIVINGNAKIGRNCTIFHNVTIGDSMSGKPENRYPTIGDNVTIYANSVIIGGITIGDNAVIGAGSVVLKDVPPNAVVAGNPAKTISKTLEEINCI